MASDGGVAGAGGGSAGSRLYDRWSRHRGALGLLYRVVFMGREHAVRRRSVEALGLSTGDRVLELGCGTGNSFAALRRRVGEAGRVVGVDYSAGMVARAADRIEEAGWDDVHVVRGDAARLGVGRGTFDAVYAAMSVSAMPDVGAVLREAHDALRPGGRIVVLDARPFRARPWTLLNPLVVPVATRLTNWFPEVDVPAAMRRTFGDVAVTDTNGGSIFVAFARRGADDDRGGPDGDAATGG